MIRVEGISKSYRVAKRTGGFSQAVKALFRREYSEIQALQEISFQIDTGETVGCIGPNGAGKSSTIKVMSGVLTPDRGQCLVNGLVPWRDRKKHAGQIGVVFGQRSQLWWDVPVIDSFELLRDIYKIPPPGYRNKLEELTELLNLSELLKTPARQLSLGQRMRCEIAAALLHNPKVLFLDEPTIGLDAVSKLAVRSFIQKLNQTKKTTVLLTTHDMSDIEAITQRVILIGKGKILLDGSLDTLKQRNSPYRTVTIRYLSGSFPPLAGAEPLNPETRDALSQTPAAFSASSQASAASAEPRLNMPTAASRDRRVREAKFRIDSRILSLSQLIQTYSHTADLQDVSVAPQSIDDTVVSLYRSFDL